MGGRQEFRGAAVIGKAGSADITSGELEIARQRYEGYALHFSKFVRHFALAGSLGGLFILGRAAARKATGRIAFTKKDFDGLDAMLVERFEALNPERIAVEMGEGRMTFTVSQKTMLWTLGVIQEVIVKNAYRLSEEKVKGKVVIDAGANVGVFSVYAGHLGAKEVHSFEPGPDVYGALVEAVRLNPGLKIYPSEKGLGSENKKVTFQWESDSPTGGMVVSGKASGNSSAIEIILIDSYVKGKKLQPGFIKIDTEGYEIDVLEGAKETIGRFKPSMSMEWHEPGGKGPVMGKLKELGYSPEEDEG